MDKNSAGRVIAKSLAGIFGMLLIGLSVLGAIPLLFINALIKSLGGSWNWQMILYVIALVVCLALGIFLVVIAGKRKKTTVENNEK